MTTETVVKSPPRDALCSAEELIASDIWTDATRPTMSQIQQWTAKRRIPCCKPGNQMLYRPVAVLERLTDSPRKRNAKRIS